MEDDDEFGDLYTDVLRPVTTSFGSKSQQQSEPSAPTEQKQSAKAGASSTVPFPKRPIDLNLNSDDDEEEGFYVAPNSNTNSNSVPQNQTLASAKPGFNFRPAPKEFDLNKDSGQGVGNFEGLAGVESDSQARVLEKKDGDGKLPDRTFGGSSLIDEPDINVFVEERDEKDSDFVVKDDNLSGQTKKVANFTAGTGNVENFGSGGGETGPEPIIPGVSIPGVSAGSGSHANAKFEDDWDSDSEDDLQIVLNDNNHGPMGMDRLGGGGMVGEEDDEDDEDGEPLVIVADNDGPTRQPMMMDEQEWGGEEVGPPGDGDRKELGDAAKVNGAGVVSVAPKVGYSNHVYHHPFHSQFKVSDVAAHLGFGAFILLFDQNLKSKLPCKFSRVLWKLITLELINAVLSVCANEIGYCTGCNFH